MSTPSAHVNVTAARLAESLACLPPLPATAQKILTCFGDEFIDAEKVASVVESDPGICAKLLGLANSAYFGLAQPVNSIDEAISRVLGVDTVRSLVLAMAIQRSFNRRNCPAFNAERFWARSLMVAESCKRISAAYPSSGEDVRDLAYSTGLCHNLGLMALAHLEPQHTNAALAAYRDAETPANLRGLLAERLDTDHRFMTAELAANWSLPKPMIDAYKFRAGLGGTSTHRLGLVVAIAAAAVENSQRINDEPISISSWAAELGVGVEALQKCAEMDVRHTERVESLASNMTR